MVGKHWIALVMVGLLLGLSSQAIAGPQESKKSAEQSQDKECCTDGTCEKCVAQAAADKLAASTEKEDAAFSSTHRQTSVFAPEVDGKSAALGVFRVRDDGNLVVAVSPKRRARRKKKDSESRSAKGYVQIYSPELELVSQHPLEFVPSAMALDKSGRIFVGGEGKLVKMSRDGEVLISKVSPTMESVDMDELRAEIRETLEKQQEQIKKSFAKQIESLSKQVEKVEAIEEEERTKADKRKLTRIQSQLNSYKQFLKQQGGEVTEEMIDQRLQYSSGISAITVTAKDLFMATTARSGSGFEVYRMNHELEGSECVIKRLRGCCGQMDVYAHGENVYVAENTKFKVGVYDREGNSLASFGDRLKGDNQGFGSCCNPMNVHCCSNGDILTAESSVGKIKRFNTDGEMVGYVGKAMIGGGCKKVTIGFDEGRDRYYVQSEDANEICVLNPAKSEKGPAQE